MSTSAAVVLILLLSLATAGFGVGVWALGASEDLFGVIMCGFGALGLRAAWQAARVAEGGGT